MMYDLIAAFYVNANDAEPRYKAPMGMINVDPIDYFKYKGFRADPDSTEGYLDYIKELRPDQVGKWCHKECEDEVLSILTCGLEYERILLSAIELDMIDDDGNYPPRGLMISNTFVEFSGTAPWSPVYFSEFGRIFHIPLKKLKGYFDVLTMFEVLDRLQVFADGHPWTFDQLKDYFEGSIDDALDIVLHHFFGRTDRNGQPLILSALEQGLAANTKTDRIVGFLKNVVTDSPQEWPLDRLVVWGFSADVIAALQRHLDQFNQDKKKE